MTVTAKFTATDKFLGGARRPWWGLTMAEEDHGDDAHEEPVPVAHTQRKSYGNKDADPLKNLHTFIVEQVFGFEPGKPVKAVMNYGAETQCAHHSPLILINNTRPSVLTLMARQSQRRHRYGANELVPLRGQWEAWIWRETKGHSKDQLKAARDDTPRHESAG
jgi:hypothetical protein